MAEHRQSLGGTTFIEAGSGEPLLLIHGVGMNVWRPQIEAFAATHRVIAIDMLGHGGSVLPPADATLDDYVQQARRLLDDLGIASANVVGHSMGGLVAMGLYRAQSAEARELDSQVRLQEHLARTRRGEDRMSDEALRQLRRMRDEARFSGLLGRAT